jgi:hypothetical protein
LNTHLGGKNCDAALVGRNWRSTSTRPRRVPSFLVFHEGTAQLPPLYCTVRTAFITHTSLSHEPARLLPHPRSAAHRRLQNPSLRSRGPDVGCHRRVHAAAAPAPALAVAVPAAVARPPAAPARLRPPRSRRHHLPRPLLPPGDPTLPLLFSSNFWC